MRAAVVVWRKDCWRGVPEGGGDKQKSGGSQRTEAAEREEREAEQKQTYIKTGEKRPRKTVHQYSLFRACAGAAVAVQKQGEFEKHHWKSSAYQNRDSSTFRPHQRASYPISC